MCGASDRLDELVKYTKDRVMVPKYVFRKHDKRTNPFCSKEEIEKFERDLLNKDSVKKSREQSAEIATNESDLIAAIINLFESSKSEPEMLNILNKYRHKLSQDAQDFLSDQIKEMLDGR